MADTPAAKPFPIPLSYFGIALGTAGLGMSWRYAATVGQAPAWPGESLLALAGVVWLLLMLGWFTKFLAFRQAFRADFQDLVQCCFISLIPITTIMSGLSLRPYAAAPAEVLIYVGIVGQLIFSMYRAAGLWRGLHTSKATTPIIYLPTVATSFVSAMAMSAMRQPEIATLFFGAGVLSWMSLEAAILGRLRTETAIDPKVRGIIGIQLAPAFVGCSAYFGINGGQVDMVALMLIGYGTLQLLFLLRLLPWVLEGGFTMSLWGFSFGLAAMAGCGMHLGGLNPRLALLGHGLWGIGTALVGADGLSSSGGLTTHDDIEARTNHTMIERAQRVIAVADASKIGHVTLAKMADLSEIDILVVLRGDNDGIDVDGFAVLVRHRDLRLAVGTQILECTVLAHIRQTACKLMREHRCERHILGRLVRRIAEHHALIACTDCLCRVHVALARLNRLIDALRDIRRLLVE